ncbi:hypothetical protein [Streptomyces sp. NPDC059788]|uniref:hypothetical protein n=1 Tax=Streptomyces sp. NPDC059788 TaxID=3346948 RepID=UPI0036658493
MTTATLSAADLSRLPRQLPAGNPRSDIILDAVADVLRAAGEDVHVVYAAHGDMFKIAPKGES